MSLYASAVKRPIMTTLCFVAVVIIGLFSLSTLPIDLYPDIEPNTLMVMTSYSGASAADIEQNVTRPLENSLNAVNDLKHITSKSRENISVITLEFEYGKDIDVLTNDVRDKLTSGTVVISGAPKREIHIYVDPKRLEAYNLSVETISSLIAAENRNIPGGSFDIGSDTYSLRVQGEFSSTDHLKDLIVGSQNGRNIYLRDVARVEDSLEERAQETYNNGVQGAMIVFQKQSGARRPIRQYPQHHRFACRDSALRLAVCDYRSVLLPRTMARHHHHHPDHTYLTYSIVYLSGHDRQFAEHRFSVGIANHCGYGGR